VTDNIAVKGLGSLAYKSSLETSDIPDLSGSYLPISGGTLTGDLRLKSSGDNYGRRIRFGDTDYAYIYEDTDDHLTVYASKGITLTTGSGYGVSTNNYIDIGDARLVWDATNHAIHITKRPGSSYTGDIGVYADGFVAAGGVGQSS
jgi:hypothetical protein